MEEEQNLLVYKIAKRGDRTGQLLYPLECLVAFVVFFNVFLIMVERLPSLARYAAEMHRARLFFFVFFALEYGARIWAVRATLPQGQSLLRGRILYLFSFRALIDLFALFPILFGNAVIDFRVFRILKLLEVVHLGSVDRYTATILKVFRVKGVQLLTSLFIALIFMLVSAVIIFDLEHQAQPEVYGSIFSALWWAISATTTIGYGDIFPITPAGRVFGATLSVLGIFLMAVPVGILTTGFFEVTREPGGQDEDQHRWRRISCSPHARRTPTYRRKTR